MASSCGQRHQIRLQLFDSMDACPYRVAPRAYFRNRNSELSKNIEGMAVPVKQLPALESFAHRGRTGPNRPDDRAPRA